MKKKVTKKLTTYFNCFLSLYHNTIRKKYQSQKNLTIMTTANQILSQLGGNKFLAMTGAHTLINTGSGLTMKLRSNKSKANYLKITLNAMDTYTVEFQKVNYSKFTVSDVANFENVYCDQLQKIFTSVTGMYTKL